MLPDAVDSCDQLPRQFQPEIPNFSLQLRPWTFTFDPKPVNFNPIPETVTLGPQLDLRNWKRVLGYLILQLLWDMQDYEGMSLQIVPILKTLSLKAQSRVAAQRSDVGPLSLCKASWTSCCALAQKPPVRCCPE